AGYGIADGLDDVQLSFAIQVLETSEGRVKSDFVYAGEGKGFFFWDIDIGSCVEVFRIVLQRDDRIESVVAALELDEDQDRIAGGRGLQERADQGMGCG